MVSSKKKIVIATQNKGKLSEFVQLTQDLPIVFVDQISAGVVGIAAETGTTFVENAIIKARFAAEQTGLPAIADDSGLIVGDLNGEPGVYSSCYSGVEGDFNNHIQKLFMRLAQVENAQRAAHFCCTLVYLRHAHDPVPVIAQAFWHGVILTEAQGIGGFGYDPIFYIPELQCSAAELSAGDKNKLSHRGQAFQKLRAQLQTEFFAQ